MWTSTKFVHMMPLGSKLALPRGDRKSELRNKEANLQNSSLKLESIEIWYVASPWGPLPSLFITCPWGQNWSRPGGHKLNIGTQNENFVILLL